METQTATEIQERNLSEVLTYRDANMQLDHSSVVAAIVSGGGMVCESCMPKSLGKAETLASCGAEIGRISIADAAQRLAEFNSEVCGHLGSYAMSEVPEPELVNA